MAHDGGSVSYVRHIAAAAAGRFFDAERFASLARSRGCTALVLNYHLMRTRSMHEHLAVLEDLFDIVPLDELVARSREPLQRGARVPAALTFDDGKRSHLTEIAPALKQRGHHGTFFVTSDPVATDGIHWFDLADRARHAFDALLAGAGDDALREDLRGRFAGLLRARKRDGRAVWCVDFDRWKRMDAARRDASVHELAERLGIDPRPIDDDERALTPGEVHALVEAGFTVGSHSATHPILVHEDEERLRREIDGSRARIAEWIGEPVRHFCYPNGNANAATEAATRRAGYETAWVTEPVWLGPRENPHRLPRVQIFEHYDRGEIALKALLATVGALPDPDGTGRAYVQRRAGR